jgi:opacity protein-like surface antigen
VVPQGLYRHGHARRGGIFAEEYKFNDFTIYHKDIKSTPLFGMGVGYDTGHYFRFDITGEYRGKSLFVARTLNPVDFNFNAGTNEWTADIESWVGLFNTYIDIGTWLCVTPYVGGGVGFASISVLGLKDVNVPNNGVAFGKDNTETNFAWAAYGGLSYDVTPAVTIDLSYRYLDIGDASSGPRTNYLGGDILATPDREHHLARRDARRALEARLSARADAGFVEITAP